MKKTGLLLIGMLLWYGCGGDENEDLSDAYAQIRVVTGLDIVDENGNAVGTWEKPNHNPGPLRLYPIPTGNQLFVSSQTIITDVWIVPASCEKDTTNRNIQLLSLDLDYDLNQVEMNEISSLKIDNFNNQVTLNLEGSSKGFYKLFARTTNNDLFWQNFYYDPDLIPLLDWTLLDEACN